MLRSAGPAGPVCTALVVCVLGVAVTLLAGGRRAVAGPRPPQQEPAQGSGQEAASQPDLDARIAELIQQLGAPEYATRQRAQDELRRLRLDAFDALNEAQLSDDLEVASTARYLVRSIQVNWATEDDAAEVRQLLRGYGSQSEPERRNRIEQLGLLGPELALRPLCRLVRYEASEKLSKRAALLVMGLPVGDDAAREELVRTLRARAGQSKRVAADWLRAYALWLADDPAAGPRWEELVAAEQTLLIDAPDQTNRELTRDVLKWYADQLTLRNRPEEALAAMRNLTRLLNGTAQEVLDAVDWFRARQSREIILDLAAQFPETFRRTPLLLYRLAETYRQLGQGDKADEANQLALAATPDDAEKHLELAANLHHDGLFEAAELEYRHVAKRLDRDPLEAIRANLFLSEMLHELRRDGEAAETVQQAVTAIEGNAETRTLFETELGRDLGSTRSRMHFFQAEQAAQQGEVARQRALLLEGYQHDPHDADLLIGMHRVPGADETWVRETQARVKQAADDYRQQLKDLQQRVAEGRSAEDRALASYQLAVMYNQLAWLLANTGGDADEAIKCSTRSLELMPDRAGFLDTLGRCYFAKGDYATAVQHQSRAVALEPHSPTMRAQLELFTTAWREQERTPPPGAGD
jgi:tetratricopeptide (TPR) repeat protein